MSLDVLGLSVRIPLPDRRRVHAVTTATVTASPGRVHYLVGGSGCGKSTLLAAVTGLLPRAAEVSGEVTARVAGRQVTAEELHAARGRLVGVVPQSPATSFTPVRRLGAQLEETVRCLRGERGTKELLSLVGLDPDALRRYPFELSGGMAQRAAIAASLAGAPPILVADEPTASLDPQSSTEVMALLSELAATGCVVLVATHDLATIGAVATRGVTGTSVAPPAQVSVMFASRIVETGPAERVLRTPSHPYTRDLLRALPENGLHPLPCPVPDLIDLPEDFRYGP